VIGIATKNEKLIEKLRENIKHDIGIVISTLE